LPHITLNIGFIVVSQSLGRIQPLIVNARIETRQQKEIHGFREGGSPDLGDAERKQFQQGGPPGK
jgi:hypothetical protein